MTPKPDGGPAFARSIGYGTLMVAGEAHNLEVAPQAGMSLRDYFAGQALLRVHAEDGRYGPEGVKQVAKYSYAMADAMLAERAK